MLKSFLLATRPKTLVAAFIPPLMAHSYYVYKYNETSYYFLSLCVAGAILIQIASNFYNDAIDSIKGADEKRVGPKRMSASGDLTPKSLLFSGHFLNLIVAVIGYFIYQRGGTPYIFIGLTSIYLSYGYTGGPFPLAYLGLGEVFVLLYFGFIAVCGSYYLYALELDLLIFIIAIQIGFLSTTLIMINNFRDRFTDKEVGKNTLATKLSEETYMKIFYVCLFSPHLLQFFFLENIQSLMTIFAMPMMVKVHSTIAYDKSPKALNEALKLSGIHILLFGIFASLGLIL